MAKVETNVLHSWSDFFNKVNSFNNPMITVTVNVGQSKGIIQINDNARIEMSSSTSYKMRTSYNGNTLNEATLSYSYLHTLFCVSNNFFYAQWASDNNLQMFVYEMINGKSYCGSTLTTPVSQTWFKTIDQITMKDTDNNSYKHANRLAYTLGSGKMEYYEKDCLFASDGLTKSLDDPNLICCTEVPENKIITFDNKQHYSLNKHILILKDGLL